MNPLFFTDLYNEFNVRATALHATTDIGATGGTTAIAEVGGTGCNGNNGEAIGSEMQSPASSDLVPLHSTWSTCAAMIIRQEAMI